MPDHRAVFLRRALACAAAALVLAVAACQPASRSGPSGGPESPPGGSQSTAPATSADAPHPRQSTTPGPGPGGSAGQGAGPGQTASAGGTPGGSAPGAATGGGTGAEALREPCAAERCVDLVVTGDVLLHPALWEQAAADARDPGALDFAPLLAGLAPFLAAADLAVCSLETPVAAPGGPYSGYPAFNVPPEIVPALAATGYDACTTETNHTVDAGTAGLRRTLDELRRAGLASTGSYASAADASRPLVLDAGGTRIGLVTATYSLNGLRAEQPWMVDLIDVEALKAKARTARAEGAELVVAGLHAGEEYSSTPNAQQLQVSRALAEIGEFDFIYGHHTHSVLPLELHAGTWIAYGLGNSVARHATDLAVNREGLTVAVRFEREDGTWRTAAPRWAAHIMARAPYRWCALPSATACTSPAEDAASLARTTATVNAMDAERHGARRWEPDTGVVP
ncbi:CapA family protein [Zafaria sp. Z1313]|uniref:CapA family protein n=1 Tax=Zafaria sp. Z1313 TaxID=3423202 RepID=UPI003D303B73